MTHADALMGIMPQLMVLPPGDWSIAFDLYMRAIEDPVPHGWQSSSARHQRRIREFLKSCGYKQNGPGQFSQKNSTALDAVFTIGRVAQVPPAGSFATVVKGVTVSRMDNVHTLDVTGAFRAGGSMGRTLLDSPPHELANTAIGLAGAPAPVLQARPAVQPHGTVDVTPASQNVGDPM